MSRGGSRRPSARSVSCATRVARMPNARAVRARRERRRRQSWLGRSAARPLRSRPMPPHRRVPRKPPAMARTAADALANLEEAVRVLAAAEAAAESAATAARDRLTGAEARAAESVARLAAARADVAGAEAHREALERRLRSGLDAAILGVVEAAGGRRVDAGLEVEPDLRRAVAAALGDVLTAMTAPASVIGDLAPDPRCVRHRWSPGCACRS